MLTKIQAVTFEIEQQSYGVDILLIDEILPMLEIKPIPKGPEFLEGVINLRGDVIPIIDLRRNFGYPKKEFSTGSRILISSFHSRKLGFIVENVREISEFTKAQIYPSVVDSTQAPFINEMVRLDSGLMIQLISISEILNENSLNQLSKLNLD